jgi:flagellar hook-associated protein 3 FlgL
MRVTFNTNYRNTADAIARNAAELASRQREVSSGKRVHVASDDPVAAAALVAERAELAVSDRYLQATDNVASRLSVVDAALGELVNQTSAAKVAALSARGSQVSDLQRQAAADQLEGIRDAVLSAINTQFRGTYLFAGDESRTRPYEKAAGVVGTYQGGDDAIDVDIDRQTSVTVGIAGNALLQGGDAADLFTVLDDLMTAVGAGDDAGMQAGIDALDRALNRMASAQNRVGTDLSNIDSHKSQLETRRLGSQAQVSSLEDANLAESISAMNKADTAYRAALGAISSTQQLSLLDYLK